MGTRTISSDLLNRKPRTFLEPSEKLIAKLTAIAIKKMEEMLPF